MCKTPKPVEQPSSNNQLAHALERVAVYRKDETTLRPCARSMIALADEIERLQRELTIAHDSNAQAAAGLQIRVQELESELEKLGKCGDQASPAVVAPVASGSLPNTLAASSHEPGTVTNQQIDNLLFSLRSNWPAEGYERDVKRQTVRTWLAASGWGASQPPRADQEEVERLRHYLRRVREVSHANGDTQAADLCTAALLSVLTKQAVQCEAVDGVVSHDFVGGRCLKCKQPAQGEGSAT